MAAYVISEVEIVDEEPAQQYRDLAAASIAEFGGRYLARAADAHVIEGQPTKRKFVIIEFPTMKRAEEWYASASYARALKHRIQGLDRRLIFLEGVPPPVN